MPTIEPTSAPAYGPAINPARNAPGSVRSEGWNVRSSRTATPAVSGMPLLNAKTNPSGHSRFSVSSLRRNQGNRTSIVDSTAATATWTTSVVRSRYSAVSSVFCGISVVSITI